MASAAIQTIWTELIATTLADAGVMYCVVSPGSRSTPLTAALAGESRLALVTLIDERAAAFYALGAARAMGAPVAMVCTSGTAAAHYLPAIVEASLANVPLIALTTDRPPELWDCGASQTIDQIKLYGGFVRDAIDLGAPVESELALRAVRRKLIQAITLARGPRPGPVHVELPLRKPLEPAAPSTGVERAAAELASRLAGEARIAPPRLSPEPSALAELAAAITAERDGAIVVGAMPAGFAAARPALIALAARAGYPILAEAGSQLRFAERDGALFVDSFDMIPPAQLPVPRLVIQLGAEPVATAWPAWSAALAAAGSARWVLAGSSWHDADAAARGVILGDEAAAIEALVRGVAPNEPTAHLQRWRAVDAEAARAVDAAIDAHPRSESAVLRAAIAAVPAGARIQLGNSLPIRVVDQVCRGGGPNRTVLTQRGAAGIDGLIASAAGATAAGQPVLLVLGDVSFAHDLGGLLAARTASAPLAILVIDNAGGQIFAGLPIARAQLGAAFERHWLTPPGVDPAAIATALGLGATVAGSPAAAAIAVSAALASPGVTVIHAPVSASGAHDVRRAALERFAPPALPRARGGSHD